MLLEDKRLRKIIAWLGAGILIIFLIVWLYRYFTVGELIVKTNNPNNYIKIDRVIKNGKGKPFSKQKQKELSIKVSSGKYNVSVYDKTGSYGVSKVVNIKAHHKQVIVLNPVETMSPEPVYGQSTASVAANSSRLLFIDTNSGSLMQANSRGLSRLFPNNSFSTINWANADFGVAKNKDNDFYVIKGNDLIPLNLLFFTNNQTPVSYDVSSGGQIYVSYEKNIYSGKPGETFKKIYSANSDYLGLAGYANKVAVIERGEHEGEGSLVVVNNSGKLVKKNIAANQASWSPNGKHLLVSGEGGSFILDSSLHKTGFIPTNDSDAFAWKDSDSFFYNIDNQLWLYNIQNQKSQKITSLPTGDIITDIYPGSDDSYIYFSNSNGEKTQLSRVSLKKRPVNESLGALSVFMPEGLDYCYLNYINFIKPTIIIKTPPNVDKRVCLLSAKTELKNYGLDAGGFSYQQEYLSQGS